MWDMFGGGILLESSGFEVERLDGNLRQNGYGIWLLVGSPFKVFSVASDD